ncbi:hypothetical protein GCM10010156_46500 [Planobispora rosea]|uniref:Uncharacterized protein n=1 Tax=Planobispora rosea TaxID=35762 RepID=A0A8J3S0Y3_PLARO|nr:hypothetical protein GCM10010156_46500 [Planobispora rosea]GIH84235.1 hypothetical protein Pro02_26430 [Planobispora rosea]
MDLLPTFPSHPCLLAAAPAAHRKTREPYQGDSRVETIGTLALRSRTHRSSLEPGTLATHSA